MATGSDLNKLAFVGMMCMWDAPRPGVCEAVSRLQRGQVDIKMITGDSQETGEAIGERGREEGTHTHTHTHTRTPAAHRLGLCRLATACPCEELETYSPQQLQHSVGQHVSFLSFFLSLFLSFFFLSFCFFGWLVGWLVGVGLGFFSSMLSNKQTHIHKQANQHLQHFFFFLSDLCLLSS